MSALALANTMFFGAWRSGAKSQLARLLCETDGQDVIEYALLTTFIGFVGAAAWNTIVTALGSAYGAFSGPVWNDWEPADPVGGGS